MDNFENQDNFYGTGSTRPPKSHSGIVALLIILVIVFGSMISLLSIWNIQLFQQLDAQNDPELSPVAFSELSDSTANGDTQPAYDSERKNHRNVEMNIAQTPQSVDNIPQTGGLSLQQIYAQSVDSVVSITCSMENGASSGTGVVLTSDGYIVTNCHVIDGAKTIWVRFTDRRELTAAVVGKDEISDLAVLRVEANALKAAEFGDSGALRVGDAVVAIGDPLGAQLSSTMTDGIVSAINRDITTGGRKMTLIQTNAALNAGNSGGPLINCYGQVIGINTMKIGGYLGDSGVEGLGFAIPSRTVKTVVDQLIAQGYVSGRPTLALSAKEVTSLYQRYYGWPAGACVDEVVAGGAADMAGIEPGDILVKIDDRRITDVSQMNEAVYAYQPGDQVEIILYRGGRYYSAKLTIGEVE